MVRYRVRIRFRKQGDLRLIGHRDLVRVMERLFRRAGLRLGMSQGFHPRPRMSFPSALAVGIEGLDEAMELELAEPCAAEELLERLVAHTVPGLAFPSVECLPGGSRKARMTGAAYQVPIPADRRAEVADRAARLMARPFYPVQRPGKGDTIDLRPSLMNLSLRHDTLTMRLSADRQPSVGPRDVLRALGLEGIEREGACLTRTVVELQS
ncbi:MAG: TIGR03936 family radical SAM-associated protein [Planctomycetota bacterium]|jgi:radical SAM-linked protein